MIDKVSKEGRVVKVSGEGEVLVCGSSLVHILLDFSNMPMVGTLTCSDNSFS
jgi:hypothetical protein